MENKKELYSDNWEAYQGEYWKREYDIKLKDGTIVENCYPNGGKFNSISDEHNQQDFDEKDVVEIRFSHRPRYGINGKVSSIPQYEWLDAQEEKRKSQPNKPISKYSTLAAMAGVMGGLDTHYEPYLFDEPRSKGGYLNGKSRKIKGKITDIRTEPKINRNEPCTCGSGLKFKKCCL